MLNNRVIPCLLLKNGGLVKTQKFGNPKYVGDPVNAIRIFNEKEVDELLILDIDASKNGSGPNYNLISQFAGECFMPLTYGGGIHTVDQAKKLFAIGIEKVCLQTAVLKDLSIITEITKKFGSQSVVISVDIKKNWFGKYCIYSASDKKKLSMDLYTYISSVVSAGAGEIVVNFVDRDGMMNGMELAFISELSKIVSVPLIAMGGVGSLLHIKQAIQAGANAVAVGSFFVFHGPHRAVLITYPKYTQLTELLRV